MKVGRAAGPLIGRAAWAISVALLLSGCSATKKKPTADDLYRAGEKEFQEKNYTQAIEKFRELLDQYPFSDYAEEAELKIAHAHYKDEHYPEAIAAFNDFQRMHPTSAHLPMVYYLMGMSFVKQMSTIDRDQSAAENAHGWLRVAIDRYPNSRYAKKAAKELAKCREALAEHELYVAGFYFRRGNRSAAKNRVKTILELYPDTAVAPRALAKLVRQERKAGKKEAAELALRALVERFPESPEALRQKKKLAGNETVEGAFAKLVDDLRNHFGASTPLSETPPQPTVPEPKKQAAGGPPAPAFKFPTGGIEPY